LLFAAAFPVERFVVARRANVQRMWFSGDGIFKSAGVFNQND
jgi:hypothetical protein